MEQRVYAEDYYYIEVSGDDFFLYSASALLSLPFCPFWWLICLEAMVWLRRGHFHFALYMPPEVTFIVILPVHRLQLKTPLLLLLLCFGSEQNVGRKKKMPNVRFTLPTKNDPRTTQPNNRQHYLPENVITAQPSSNGLTKRLMKWRKKDYQLIDSTREKHYRNGFVSFYCLIHLHNHFC